MSIGRRFSRAVRVTATGVDRSWAAAPVSAAPVTRAALTIATPSRKPRQREISRRLYANPPGLRHVKETSRLSLAQTRAASRGADGRPPLPRAAPLVRSSILRAQRAVAVELRSRPRTSRCGVLLLPQSRIPTIRTAPGRARGGLGNTAGQIPDSAHQIRRPGDARYRARSRRHHVPPPRRARVVIVAGALVFNSTGKCAREGRQPAGSTTSRPDPLARRDHPRNKRPRSPSAYLDSAIDRASCHWSR